MKKKLLVFGVAALLVLFVVAIGLADDPGPLLDPEFSVGGEFRTLSYYIGHPDLTARGPMGDQERGYSEQRLILDPVLKLNDFVTIKMRIRALDYIWGYNTVGGLTWPTMIGYNPAAGGTFPVSQGEAGTNNFQFDRAWVQLTLGKYGSLQVGRQDTELFHNFSISSEDTYPRYHYITPVFGLGGNRSIMFGILYDERQEGNIDTVGIPGTASSYYSFAWCPWFFYMSPKLTVGYVCFVWDTKNMGPQGQAGNWIMNDWMIDATLGPVDIKSEWDIDCGKMIMSYLDCRDNFEFFIDAGAPLATPVIPRVGALVAYFEGVSAYDYTNSTTVHGGALGSNRDWVIEQDIDLILWNQIYNGAINNAWILRPKINFAIPNTKWGGWLSACISFADQDAKYQRTGINNTTNDTNPYWTYIDAYTGTSYNIAGPFPNLTSGSAKTMGTEVDLGISYTLAPRDVIELVLGVFSPGDYFASSNRDATFGCGLKTMIRF